MTFKEAAKVILKEAGRPLTARELVAQALKRQVISGAGKTPWLTMGAQIAREIKYKGPLSDFKRSGPGKFVLNEQKAAIEEQVRPDRITEELREEEDREAEGGYVGKAGEHAVLSELLFRGYNASIMSVDTGRTWRNYGRWNVSRESRSRARRISALTYFRKPPQFSSSRSHPRVLIRRVR